MATCSRSPLCSLCPNENVHNLYAFCFQFGNPLFKNAGYYVDMKNSGSREPLFFLRRSLFSTSLLSNPKAPRSICCGGPHFILPVLLQVIHIPVANRFQIGNGPFKNLFYDKPMKDGGPDEAASSTSFFCFLSFLYKGSSLLCAAAGGFFSFGVEIDVFLS